MIQYNQLSAEGKLYIDMQVEDKSYFENIYITGVRIDTADTYGKQYPYEEYKQKPSKELIKDFVIPNLKNEILFITPYVDGYPSEDTPCGQDVCDKAYIYCDNELKNKGLGYLRELGLDCQIPKGFIDYILKVFALDLSLQTCNYDDAAKFWKYIKGSKIKAKPKKCGCHG